MRLEAVGGSAREDDNGHNVGPPRVQERIDANIRKRMLAWRRNGAWLVRPRANAWTYKDHFNGATFVHIRLLDGSQSPGEVEVKVGRMRKSG